MSSSKSTDKETERFKNALFPLDENGDISFNIKNLDAAMKSVQQLALKCIKLNATGSELKRITNEQLEEDTNQQTLQIGLEAIEKNRAITPSELEQIETNVICILKWLIQLLGHKLTEDEIETIIVEGENGDIDLEKILSILDKEETIENKAITKCNNFSEMNAQTLKRRMLCLGIISKAIAKSMSEEDLIDMLLSVDGCKDQPGSIKYSKSQNEEHQQYETMYKFGKECKKTLFEMRNVISAFGSVLINKAHILSESNFKQLSEKEWNINDSVLPRTILRLIEKELTCGEIFGEILAKFCILDQQGDGFVSVDDFKEILTKFPETFTDEEIGEFLKDATVNECGQINYRECVEKMTQKKE